MAVSKMFQVLGRLDKNIQQNLIQEVEKIYCDSPPSDLINILRGQGMEVAGYGTLGEITSWTSEQIRSGAEKTIWFISSRQGHLQTVLNKLSLGRWMSRRKTAKVGVWRSSLFHFSRSRRWHKVTDNFSYFSLQLNLKKIYKHCMGVLVAVCVQTKQHKFKLISSANHDKSQLHQDCVIFIRRNAFIGNMYNCDTFVC